MIDGADSTQTRRQTMFAAVSQLSIKPGKIEDAVRLMEESLPGLKREPGHRGALLLTDEAKNEVVVIGLWETAGDAEAWMTQSSAGEAQRERFRAVVVTPPTVRTIDAVRVQDLP